jgi:osmoprotectant transport system ATP-binding protein
MFELVSVRKTFNGKAALEDVSLVTARGKTTALIGPSGCGKSTVLGLMTGLLKPDSGTITFEDRIITPIDLQGVRRRLGYVIQDGGLFPHLTGLANVTLMARHVGWAAAKIRNRVEELSTLTRLSSELLARFPAEISGGQRQRVSLMRALMLDADVLLLDEPLAALDPIFRRLQKTVVLVTHDMNEAAFFADQIVLMRAGRIVQAGTVDDLYDRPAETFVGQFVRAQQGRLCGRLQVDGHL